MNILFICRGNLQRSPTAEDMFNEMAEDNVNVKSAGIYPSASTRVSREILDWADKIYIMTRSIRENMESEFSEILSGKEIKIFGIEDRYIRGEPRLKRRLIEEFSKDNFLSQFVNEEDVETLMKNDEA